MTVDSVVFGVVSLTLAIKSVPFFVLSTSVVIDLRGLRLNVNGSRSWGGRNISRFRSWGGRNVNRRGRGRRNISGFRLNRGRCGCRGNVDRLLSGLFNLFGSFSFSVALSIDLNETPVALAGFLVGVIPRV